jgi:exopolysaccharide production protein ExoQ
MQSDKTTAMTILARLPSPACLIGVSAFLIPLLTVYIPLSLAVMLPVGVASAIICRLATGRPHVRPDQVSALLLAGFVILAACSVAWSYSTGVALDKLPRTAVIVVLGILFVAAMNGLQGRTRKTVICCFVSGVAAALFFVVIERISGGIFIHTSLAETSPNVFLNQFNRPLSILSIFIWPAAIKLAQIRRRYGVTAIVATFVMLLAFQTGAAIAAVALGAIAGGCVYISSRVATLAIGSVLAASIVLAPTVQGALPPPKQMFETLNLPRSAYHRLLIWQFVARKIEERPILGWGFNTSRQIPGGKDNLDTSETALPLHPHNAAMQWRLELGIFGALFGAGLFVTTIQSTRRHVKGRIEQAGAVAAVTSAFTIAMLSFGIWQSWWMSGLFLVAGFTALVCRDEPAAATG